MDAVIKETTGQAAVTIPAIPAKKTFTIKEIMDGTGDGSKSVLQLLLDLIGTATSMDDIPIAGKALKFNLEIYVNIDSDALL